MLPLDVEPEEAEEEEDEVEPEEPEPDVEPEVELVELEPNRLVVARKVDAEPVALEDAPADDPEEPVAVDPVEDVEDELEEDVVVPPPPPMPPPPPPPRMPRNCGAASEANLSAEVTPVRRIERSSVPEATTAVRTPVKLEPERAGSFACLQANQPAPASKATTRRAIPLLDRGRFGS